MSYDLFPATESDSSYEKLLSKSLLNVSDRIQLIQHGRLKNYLGLIAVHLQIGSDVYHLCTVRLTIILVRTKHTFFGPLSHDAFCYGQIGGAYTKSHNRPRKGFDNTEGQFLYIQVMGSISEESVILVWSV